MKPKKILMPPEGRPAQRKSPPIRKAHGAAAKPQIIVSSRQRNEAIGLVLIGTSAFSLSLLHYLHSSKAITIVSTLSVQFGLGIYIIPAFLGIWGIQRFLDRTFENLNVRVAGCCSALLFGLGLLGLEGGKLGTLAFGSVSRHFGNIPTTILFSFFFLASVIFALDIVYKDLLMAGVMVFRFLLRATVAAWEATLALLGMTIEAVRSTTTVLALAVRSILSMLNPPPLDEARESLGKLLTFGPGMVPATTAGSDESIDVELEPAPAAPIQKGALRPIAPPTTTAYSVQTAGQEADVCQPVQTRKEKTEAPQQKATAPVEAAEKLPSPTLPVAAPLSGPIEEAEEAELVAMPATSTIQVHIQDLSTGICMPTPRATPISPAEPVLFPPMAAPVQEEVAEAAPVAAAAMDVAETPMQESLAMINEPEVAVPEPRAEDELAPDAPVSLDTHPIDKDIKAQNETAIPLAELPTEVELPPLELLNVPPARTPEPPADLVCRSEKLLKTLADFNIKAEIIDVVEGPAVSRFELKPGPGVKTARILGLSNDISLSLAAPIRIEAPIPGKSAIGIEIPNIKPTPVFFYDLVKNEKFRDGHTVLNLALGMTISNRPVFANLADMPHLLIAGSTGAGKSVCINTIIASILFQARPDQVKLLMIDPKRVELSSYNGIPHLIAPVVTDPKKASAALLWAIEEMMRRYELMETCGVRNITSYNEDLKRLQETVNKSLEPMPNLVIIIDELADLMMTASAEVEGSICRLAQMARAVGIHLVIATQRPSVDVLTGIIKANLPTRIAFMVASVVDSRTILDGKGAECLLGKGDMLFAFKGQKPLRLQGAYISDRELQALADFVRDQGAPEYVDITPTKADDEDDEDEDEATDESGSDGDGALMSQIKAYLATQEKTSTSMLQRKFKIGYNRAARIMDLLEEKGVVSPLDGSNKRRVLRKE
ncbi:MAG TPA: DNA translocase FtsK [Candidatus Ozemobacteraceae bacterium]